VDKTLNRYHKFSKGWFFTDYLNVSSISITSEINLPPKISTLSLSEIGFDPD
jgi:hypothetical protein